MYIKRTIEPCIMWYFSWRPLLFTLILSSAVFAIFHFLNLHTITLPFLPIATVGTAVAFYVGFKNNSSYDRLWESRKIWGELTNLSRALATYLIAIMPPNTPEVRQFIYRQIAYVNMLRLHLRKRSVWGESYHYTRMAKECFYSRPFEEQAPEALRLFGYEDEVDELMAKHNIPNEIMHRQMLELARFRREGMIDDIALSDLLKMSNEIFAQQGKAERIKTFPFPRQYAFYSEVFVYVFVCLLPFGLIGEFHKISAAHDWLAIPFSVLISWIFITMESVGDTSENPFEGSINDVPMSTICRNIEIDLKSFLREDELPYALQPVGHVLM